MKVGDLVRLNKLSYEHWGPTGLILEIKPTEYGTGMIVMMTTAGSQCTIPWANQKTYISEVLSEIKWSS